jgi:hypothetical protein
MEWEDVPLTMVGLSDRPLEIFECALRGTESKHEFRYFLFNHGDVVHDGFVARLYVQCLLKDVE